jgi:hypothetical protein
MLSLFLIVVRYIPDHAQLHHHHRQRTLHATGNHEARDNIEAWKSAISSAISIAADQVSHGSPFFGAEVTVAHGKEQIGRYLVSVGATPLKD